MFEAYRQTLDFGKRKKYHIQKSGDVKCRERGSQVISPLRSFGSETFF